MIKGEPLVRAGVIGPKNIAARHARAFEAIGGIKFVAAASRTGKVAEGVDFGEVHVGENSVQALLGRGDLDALYVCTTPSAHAEIDDLVVVSGLPTFVEKPIGLTRQTASGLAEPNAVGYQLRASRATQLARRVLRGKDVQSVYGAYFDQGLYDPDMPLWFGDYTQSGGQPVEQAAHIMDLARYVLGGDMKVDTGSVRYSKHIPPELAKLRKDVNIPTETAFDVTFPSTPFGDDIPGRFEFSILNEPGRQIGLVLPCSDGNTFYLTRRELSVERDGQRTPLLQLGVPEFITSATETEDRVFRDAVRAARRGEQPKKMPFSTFDDAVVTHNDALDVSEAYLDLSNKVDRVQFNPAGIIYVGS